MVYSFPYCGIEEVRSIVVGRRDENRDENPNVLDNDQIEYAIISADAQIDGILRRHYELPLVSPVPLLVQMLSRDIAIYNCTLIFAGSTPVDADHPTALRYDRARKILEDLKFNRIKLDVPVEELDSVYNDYDSPLFGTQHIFGEIYPEGYIPKDHTHY